MYLLVHSAPDRVFVRFHRLCGTEQLKHKVCVAVCPSGQYFSDFWMDLFAMSLLPVKESLVVSCVAACGPRGDLRIDCQHQQNIELLPPLELPLADQGDSTLALWLCLSVRITLKHVCWLLLRVYNQPAVLPQSCTYLIWWVSLHEYKETKSGNLLFGVL